MKGMSGNRGKLRSSHICSKILEDIRDIVGSDVFLAAEAR